VDEPHYITPNNEDDDPLVFLYFGAQTIQAYWQCKATKGKLQLWKKYFPIMHRRRKATIKIECWWHH